MCALFFSRPVVAIVQGKEKFFSWKTKEQPDSEKDRHTERETVGLKEKMTDT